MDEKEKNSFESKENVTDTKEQEYTFVKERVISKRVRVGRMIFKLLLNIALPACVCVAVCYIYLSSSGRIDSDKEETTETTSQNAISIEENQSTEQSTTEQPLSEEEEFMLLEEKLNKMIVVVAVTREKTEEELAEDGNDTETEASSGEESSETTQNGDADSTINSEGQSTTGEGEGAGTSSDEETTVGIPQESEIPGGEEPDDKITVKYTGAIVSSNGPVYIMIPYSNIENSREIVTYFHDGSAVATTIYDIDYETGLALLKVESTKVTEAMRKEIAPITVEGSKDIDTGSYVVYCGNVVGSEPMFIKGHVSNSSNQVMCTDINYNVVITDITLDGIRDGFIFNRSGKLLAIAGMDYKKLDLPGMIAGAEALDLRHIINNMLNGKKDIYVGIQSQEVTTEIEEIVGRNLPNGLYVNRVDFDSPAYNAGILPGDIITNIGTVMEPDMASYKNFIEGKEKGDEVEVTVKRRIGNEYNEYTLKVILSSRD